LTQLRISEFTYATTITPSQPSPVSFNPTSNAYFIQRTPGVIYVFTLQTDGKIWFSNDNGTGFVDVTAVMGSVIINRVTQHRKIGADIVMSIRAGGASTFAKISP
jgi:hypothetical protein